MFLISYHFFGLRLHVRLVPRQSVLWSQCRVMYLYGTVLNPASSSSTSSLSSKDTKDSEGPEVVIEAMYEPPQDNTAEGFTLLEDPREEQVYEGVGARKLLMERRGRNGDTCEDEGLKELRKNLVLFFFLCN